MDKIIFGNRKGMNKVKISRNQLCPCESGRKYKNCCIDKKVEWYIDSEGKYKRIPIIENEDTVKELSYALELHQNRFEKLFGRKMSEDDSIIFDKDSYSIEDTLKNITEVMEQVGIDPATIYAIKKTNIIATEFNEDIMTGKQIDDWNDAIDEYYNLVNNSEKNESICNKLFSEIESIIIFYGIILGDAGKYKESIEEMNTYTNSEFILFCIAKSLKTLKAIRENLTSQLTEDALNLVRSLYENYLYIIYSVNEPVKLEQYINAKIGISKGTHFYSKDKKKIISKETLTSVKGYITTYEKADSSKYSEDRIIFEYLYSFLSGFTHPDIGSIKHYTRKNRFDATTPSNSDTAMLLTVYFGVLILSYSLTLDNISNTKKSDINSVLARIIPKIKECLINHDLEVGAEYLKTCLFDRINKINLHL